MFILQIRETLNSQPQMFTMQCASDDDELNISSAEETNDDSYASTNTSGSRGRRGRGSRGPRAVRSRGGRAKGQTNLNF